MTDGRGRIEDFDPETGRFTFVRPSRRPVPGGVFPLPEDAVLRQICTAGMIWFDWSSAADLCPHCRAGAPHHRLSLTSIGGPRDYTVFDLHEIEDSGGVGLAECLAANLFDPRLLP